MEHALYGRMRLGRCIEEDLGINFLGYVCHGKFMQVHFYLRQRQNLYIVSPFRSFMQLNVVTVALS